VHGALLIGPRHPFAPRAAEWRQTLPAFEIELSCNGALADRGHGSNVLGGPLSALRHLVGLLESDSFNPPLAAGEIVSTGTLTKAMSVAPRAGPQRQAESGSIRSGSGSLGARFPLEQFLGELWFCHFFHLCQESYIVGQFGLILWRCVCFRYRWSAGC
jgi:hypothetical protein